MKILYYSKPSINLWKKKHREKIYNTGKIQRNTENFILAGMWPPCLKLRNNLNSRKYLRYDSHFIMYRNVQELRSNIFFDTLKEHQTNLTFAKLSEVSCTIFLKHTEIKKTFVYKITVHNIVLCYGDPSYIGILPVVMFTNFLTGGRAVKEICEYQGHPQVNWKSTPPL